MKILFLLAALIIPLLTSAERLKDTKPERLRLKAKTEISVTAFHEANNAFEVQMNHYTAQGPNYVTPEDLQAAIGVDGSLKDFIKQMQRDSSTIYVLKSPVLLLTDAEFAARAGAAAAKHKK